MKILLIFTLAIFLLPNMVLAVNESFVDENINFSLENISITNISIGANKTINITITSMESMYDDIEFESKYLVEYSPVGKHIDNNISENFYLTFKAPDEYNRTIDEVNLTHIILNDSLLIKGNNGTAIEELGRLDVSMNVTLNELELPPREYIFKKCFIEERAEFCSEFNFSEMIEPYKNITVLNETIENISYNVMMPYNTTKQFMEEYSEVLQQAADQMSTEREWLVRILNETLNMQKIKNDQFQNAFILENYLKNPDGPMWIELSPRNTLINITGLGEQELMDAMNVLFQGNKIAQKTEKNIVTLPMQSGIMTQEIQIVYIASNERVMEEEKQESSENTVYLSILIVSLIIVIVLFNTFVLKNRIGWKK